MTYILLSFAAFGHPVAYEGAFSFMSQNTSFQTENTLVYSPKYWLGVGVKHQQMKEEKRTNIHLGYLVKRWNEFDSQANVYFFGGPGFEKSEGESRYFTRYGAQADWESRKYYTLIKFNGTKSKTTTTETYQARVGFAPYIAGFDDFNSWLILDVKHNPKFDNETVITPTLRMFYKNVLWETGVSLKKEWMLNFMIRY
jgi:hypothetical protein